MLGRMSTVRGAARRPVVGPRRVSGLRIALVLAAVAVTIAVTVLVPPLHLNASPVLRSARVTISDKPNVVAPAASTGSALSLGVSASPGAICAYGTTGCSAGVGESRVTVSAGAETAPTPYWPNVQVAFVIETTAYDGYYYHYYGYPGSDKCAVGTQNPPCEESNGGPFFLAHAQDVANEISAANPHSNVSFAMVDFFGTDCGDWNDCGDSSKYSVDIPQFVPAASFGSAVAQSVASNTFGGGYITIVGLDDNFLHSPSITAMYGAIIGSNLDWSANTHHVVVLIGSTAPRDPSYVENYAVSPFDLCCGGTQPNGWTCEPAYVFADGVMPNCEGWVHSQDGNANDSIAALAHTTHNCVDSIGHTCTVDTIDLWSTSTDPLSAGWPTGHGAGSGPGGSTVVANTQHVISAGCDLAAATGGTWAGPSYASCPNGQSGSLAYVPHGPVMTPNTNNPTLFAALRGIGFGPVYQTLVANGSNAPMFNYAPFGNIRLSSNPQFQTSCQLANGRGAQGCQQTPTLRTIGGFVDMSWNFSTIPKYNAMYVGDTWSASFNVIAAGLPTGYVPVDACTTSACKLGGSTSVSGFYTWAFYVPRLNGSAVHQSFPLAQVDVELSGAPAPLGAPPPPFPPGPPGIGIPIAPGVPVAAPVAVGSTVGIASLSLNAAAAGFLGAGFVRVSMKNRPIAMQIAASGGKNPESKFDKASREGGSGLGKFE